MESEMARHQTQSRIEKLRRAWLVIVLFGTSPCCSPDSPAKNSVGVSATNLGVPTGNRAHAPVRAESTSSEEITVPDPSPTEPVTAVMTIRPKVVSVGETAQVLVHIRIASAHFIHAQDEAHGPFVPVAVNATLPAGVEPVGDWQVPKPEKGRGNSLVYRDSVLLRRTLKAVSSSAPQTFTVVGELQYQVCTDELCWPQGKLKLSAPLTIQSQRR
jgi:Disulphide bond corrector protein DsbC